MHRDVTSFPALRQDIAVVVSDEVAAGDVVVAAARAAGGPLLSRVEVFDVYRGDQVGAGKVSLALHLVFQAPDRTLTDAEADRRRADIVASSKRVRSRPTCIKGARHHWCTLAPL